MGDRLKCDDFSTNPGEEPVMSRERAEQFGTMLAIHLEFGRFSHMRRVIDWAEREVSAGHLPEPSDPHAVSVAEIGLDVRSVNYLEEAEIYSLAELLAATPEKIKAIPGVSDRTFQRIERCASQALRRVHLAADEAVGWALYPQLGPGPSHSAMLEREDG